MVQRNNQFLTLDAIPGFHIKDITRKDGEFVVTLEYVNEKQEKTYQLIAGKNGLRFALSSYKSR